MSKAPESKAEKAPVDVLSAEVLELAAAYARQIGEIPPMFSSAIRALRAPENDGKATSEGISDGNRFHVTRLLNSKSIKAPLYFAAMEICPDKLPAGVVQNKDLLKIFGPNEISALFGVTYIYRKAKILCDEKEWELISPLLKTDMEIGTYLGRSIPKIGPGNGLVLGAVRYIGLALLCAKDLKGFKEYRRDLKNRGIPWDIKDEIARWNCSHLHIASKLLQLLGFGLSASTGLCLGLSLPPEAPIDEDSYRWKIAALWIESLKTTGNAPNITHRGDYYPKKAEMEVLLSEMSRINSDGTSFHWIDKTREEFDAAMEKFSIKKAVSDASTSAPTAEVASEEQLADEDAVNDEVDELLEDLS